jgi:hypothetical protein
MYHLLFHVYRGSHIEQDTVHRLAAKYLDIRQTWRENQGEQLVTVCIEVRFVPTPRPSALTLGQAAKLHPCLYDYDGFWPVHDHLKRHLVSTRNKYRYLDPDLVVLHDAEAAERGEPRPPPHKKRRAVSKKSHAVDPPSPLLSPSAPNDLAIDMAESSASLQQPEPLPSGYPHPTAQRDLYHQPELPLVQRAIPQQAPFTSHPLMSNTLSNHGGRNGASRSRWAIRRRISGAF